MPKTTAQRQAEYRARRPTSGLDGNGQRRINLFVDTAAALALERLLARYGVTKQAMLAKLLIQADQAVLDKLDLDQPEWAAYLSCTKP